MISDLRDIFCTMNKFVENDESDIESNHKKRKLIVNETVFSDNKIQFSGSYFKKLIKGDHPLGGKTLESKIDQILSKHFPFKGILFNNHK